MTILLRRFDEVHEFSSLSGAQSFLHTATGKPVRTWMIKDALSEHQKVYCWDVLEKESVKNA